jgi:hypothetical protein
MCCPFAREVWFLILAALGKTLPLVQRSIVAWWRHIRALWQGQMKKGADSLFALVSWQIWKERNTRCFRDATVMVHELLSIIKAEVDQWIRAGAKNLGVLASGEEG